ncbi:hypothetical protein LENED_003007 [Lentinula edodes]|uniref:Uncharacterized protein n=1 Tax=Lentinula edodes TaxID=5353 RepID=A0A1Q3E2F6_LENED|nr:hypothetical protein LENED_003007 [Lentinula edodes]
MLRQDKRSRPPKGAVRYPVLNGVTLGDPEGDEVSRPAYDVFPDCRLRKRQKAPKAPTRSPTTNAPTDAPAIVPAEIEPPLELQ